MPTIMIYFSIIHCTGPQVFNMIIFWHLIKLCTVNGLHEHENKYCYSKLKLIYYLFILF